MSVADRQCADPEAPGFEDDDRAPFEIVLDRGEVREQQRCLLLGAPLRPATEENEGRLPCEPQRQDRREVGISRNDNPLLLASAFHDHFVGCRLKVEGTNMNGVVPRLTKSLGDKRRECVVDQEPQPAAASGSSRSRTASAAK